MNDPVPADVFLSSSRSTRGRAYAWAALIVCLAASVPYLSTLHNYFVQDDFGVVQLLARKPATYFPRWFTTAWMDDIWGYIPDEIRPFPAVTYQVTALWGAASPVANHVMNIAFHVGNGILVLALAVMAARLNLAAATFAALAFVLLPIQTESVAWITGRVDSMPAFFYLAAFLAYVRWRRASGEDVVARARSRAPASYLGAIALFFIALFSKQNTITLGPVLVLYDWLVERRPIRVSWAWMRPYVPFLLLTIGYLGLRYVVFGEVARESQLNAQGLDFFGYLVKRHLTRLVFGDVMYGSAAQWAIVAIATAAIVWLAKGRRGALLFFGPVWLFFGIAPTLVANYESPRHIYLASVGWAIVLGIAFEALSNLSRARAWRAWRPAVTAAGAALLIAYTVQLHAAVGRWNLASSVSKKAVADLERTARAFPEGSLVIAGAPISSWEWSVPYAAQPPFTHIDVSKKVYLVSPWRLHCCRSQWEEYTRRTLRAWAARADRPPVVALYWDARNGAVSRLSDREEPFLRALVPILLETRTYDALDSKMLEILDRAVAGRSMTPDAVGQP
jgi:hypothetical protein